MKTVCICLFADGIIIEVKSTLSFGLFGLAIKQYHKRAYFLLFYAIFSRKGTAKAIAERFRSSDIYQFSAGFGADVIEESVGIVFYKDADMVEFGSGITAENTILKRNGDNLILTFSDSTDQLTIKGQFSHGAWFSGWNDVETFKFADGTAWTDEQVREMLIHQSLTAGNDTVTGFYTADLIDGGSGNDTLRGLGGGDTYLFGKGSGQDVIEESIDTVYEDQPDTISFLPNVSSTEVKFLKVGNDLKISIDSETDTLTIKNHFGSRYNAVEFFKFNDGTTLTATQVTTGAVQAQSTSGNDTITGTSGADLLDGGAGNDILRGGDGADTYQFTTGFGQDVIEESVGLVTISDDDLVVFGPGFMSDEAILSRNGNDLIIRFQGLTDQVTVKGQFSHGAWFPGWNDIENLCFADGVQWTDAQVRDMLLRQSQTAGDDTVTGYWGDDVIDGGAGNDILRGLGGGDTYLFGKGSGQDVIEESVDTVYEDDPDIISFLPNVIGTEVSFLKVGNDLKISIAGTTDTLTIKNHFRLSYNAVEIFQFADGSTLTAEEVRIRAVRDQATVGNDTITGTNVSDTINGLTGNDTLQGGDGSDIYQFNAGFGQDVIVESVGNVLISDDDLAVFGNDFTSDHAILSRTGNDLIIAFQGSTDQVTVKGQFSHGAWYPGWSDIETFCFADGVTWTDAQVREMLIQQSR